MKYKLAFLAMILLMPVIIAAQTTTGNISGSVTDESNQPVPYATVMLLKASDSTLVKGEVSDPLGRFYFDKVSFGNYKVRVTGVGFDKFSTKPFTLSAQAQAFNLNTIQIKQAVKQLKEVTVTTQRPFIEQKLDRTIVNVENSIVSAGSNALEVLERAPGVTVDKDDVISLRGKSGVVIMIDNKPTYLSSADVSTMLRNMQSNGIEAIEIITNPSAKFDASGNAGIINIKMKKNKALGTNGSYTIGAGFGRFEKFSGGFSLNHRSAKWNLFSNYSYGYNHRYSVGSVTRTIRHNSTTSILTQNNYRPAIGQANNFKAGADYSINKRKTLGVMINGFANRNETNTVNSTTITDGEENLLSFLNMDNRNTSNWRSIAGNLNYLALFDSAREFSVNMDMSRFQQRRGDDLQSLERNSSSQIIDELILRSNIPSTININTLKMDYVHPLNKREKLEMGLKSSFVITDNNVRFDSLAAGEWHVSEARTNQFIYHENINAAYINYMRDLGKFSVQAGLRVEQTISKGESVTLDSIVKRNYTKLFPSLFVTHKMSKEHTVNYSYSRRIDRPGYSDLNPFIYFIDKYAYFRGNPWLQPQFTNSFSITHVFRGIINTSLGYSQTTNLFTQVPKQNDETRVTFATMENLNTLNNYNLNVGISSSFTKQWNANTNVNVFHNQVKTIYQDQPVDIAMTSFTVNTMHRLSFPRNWSAEVNAMYNSPSVNGVLRSQSRYTAGVGLQKQFWEKRGSLKFNVSDVFYTLRFRGAIKVNNMNIELNQRAETRVARLTFSYRFGRNEVKQPRRRAVGSEAEENRVDAGNSN